VRAPSVCTTPGCANTTNRGKCNSCQRRARKDSDRRRPSAADRGYGERWRRRRREFLRLNLTCVDCGATATVADHDPVSRRELVAQGVPDPDAFQYLRPRCTDCHNARTAREQPGGWNR
jgi:5-methylcytosine-specific restriction protein A